MPTRTEITVAVTIVVVTADDEELDGVCEDIHEQFGAMLARNEWTGSVEVSLSRIV